MDRQTEKQTDGYTQTNRQQKDYGHVEKTIGGPEDG